MLTYKPSQWSGSACFLTPEIRCLCNGVCLQYCAREKTQGRTHSQSRGSALFCFSFFFLSSFYALVFDTFNRKHIKKIEKAKDFDY